MNTDTLTGLTKSINDLTNEAGLEHKPVLYDVEIDKEMLRKQATVSTMPPQFQRVFNVASNGISNPVITVSEKFLQTLGQSKRHAFIADECARLKAGHSRLSLVSGWMQGTIMVAAMFGVGAVAVSGGWMVGILSVAGSLAVAYGAQKFMPKNEDRYASDGTPKPGVRRTQMGTWAVQELLSVGVLAYANPIPMLTAVAIEHGFFWTANFINKSHSRRHEFHADRGAVNLGANPLALITSLRKYEAMLEQSEPEVAFARNWRKGNLLTRGFKMVETLYKIQLDTQRRCHRLAKIALIQGYSEDEVKEALTAPVEISTPSLSVCDTTLPDALLEAKAIPVQASVLADKFDKASGQETLLQVTPAASISAAPAPSGP